MKILLFWSKILGLWKGSVLRWLSSTVTLIAVNITRASYLVCMF